MATYEEMTMMVESILDSTEDFYNAECGIREGKMKMLIHADHYYYCAGCSVTDDPEKIYRKVEFTWAYIDPDKLRDNPDEWRDIEDNCKQYITDMTLLECAEDFMKSIKDAEPLLMEDVNEETESGWYYDSTSKYFHVIDDWIKWNYEIKRK